MRSKIDYLLSILLLIAFKTKPKREYIQRIGKALSIREYNWIYEVFINYLEKDLLTYKSNSEISTKFLNKGKGSGTIRSYRKVEGKNISLFEKIYFRDQPEWKKTIDFYNKIFQDAYNLNIVAPNLVYINKGSYLVVTYTEFFDLEPIERNQYLEKAVEMATRIMNIPYQYNSNDFSEILDYNSDINFKLFKRRLLSCFKNDNNDQMIELIYSVDQYIKEYIERRLCHGDLSLNNLFKNNILIDWDRFGYYPIGYEFAMIIIRIHRYEGLSIEKYLTLENEFYSIVSVFMNKPDFKLSLSYFTLVFLHYNLDTTIELRNTLSSILKERHLSLNENK